MLAKNHGQAIRLIHPLNTSYGYTSSPSLTKVLFIPAPEKHTSELPGTRLVSVVLPKY